MPVFCPCAPCWKRSGGVADRKTKIRHAKELKQGTRQLHKEAQVSAIKITPSEQREKTISEQAPSEQSQAGQTPSDPVPSMQDQRRADSRFCLDLVSAVSQGRTTMKGADEIVKSFNRNYGAELRSNGYMPPTSVYKAKQSVFRVGEAKMFTRDFCPVCGWAFPKRKSKVQCKRCGDDTRYDPITSTAQCQAFYEDLDSKVDRIFASGGLPDFGRPRERPAGEIDDRELVDIFDGKAFEDLHHSRDDANKNHTLYFLMCQDGVEVTKGTSYTPVTAKLLNWSPKVRSLQGNIILLGFLPPHVQDYTAMLLPIAEMFASHEPAREPLIVHDQNGREHRVWYMLAATVTDIRGYPAVSCGSSPPCYVGGCNACKVKGIRPSNDMATIMPGAVRAVSKRSESGKALRRAYEHEFKSVPIMQTYHKDRWPASRSHDEALEEGEKEEERIGDRLYAKATLSKARQHLAFHGVDAFTRTLTYWDKIRNVVYDPAHEHSNMIKHIVNMIKDKSKKNKVIFNAKARMREAATRPGMKKYALRRSGSHVAPRYVRRLPDWQTDDKGKKMLDSLKRICHVPSSFPPLRKWIKNTAFVKCTEWYLLTGDTGAFFLRTSGIRGKIRSLWIQLLRIMERVMRKVSTPGDRQYIREHLPEVLAAIEIELPMAYNTAVVHIYACRTLDVLEQWGPFHVMSMLDFERFHTKFRAMARSSKNLMASIKNSYEMAEACSHAIQCLHESDRDLLSVPLRSTTPGLAIAHDSADKTDRCTRPLGRGIEEELSPSELRRINSLWAQSAQQPDEPSINGHVVSYARAEYAGNNFCTERYRVRSRTKVDDTHIRLDYKVQDGRRTYVRTIYGTIVKIFEHEHTAGDGTKKLVLKCRWLKTIGKCSIAGTTLVQEFAEGEDEHDDDIFTFLETIYQLPVALWPHEEGTGGVYRPGGKTFDVIDRNQEQYDEYEPESVAVLESPDIQRAEIVDEPSAQRVRPNRKRRREEAPTGKSCLAEPSEEEESCSEVEERSSSDDEDLGADRKWDGQHDTICSYCFDDVTDGLRCAHCPRVYHRECTGIYIPEDQSSSDSVICKDLTFPWAKNSRDKKFIIRFRQCTSRCESLHAPQE